MIRFARTGLLLLCSANLGLADLVEDQIGPKLDKAKAQHAVDVQKYRDSVEEYFHKKESVARAEGNKKLVDQIKLDADAFAKTGLLPKTAPALLGQKHAAVRKAMEDAHRAAIKQYTKAGMDTEATAVEKQLEAFMAAKPVAPKPDLNKPEPGKPEPKIATAATGRVKAGDFIQLEDNGKANPEFAMIAKAVTPNIVELRGTNGWVAYLGYDEETKEYTGTWEWQSFKGGRSPGGKWADCFRVRAIVLEGGAVKLDGKSKENAFQLTYKPK